MADELGLLAPGYLADVLVVRGNPAEDVRVLQDRDNLRLHHPGRPFPQAAWRVVRRAGARTPARAQN